MYFKLNGDILKSFRRVLELKTRSPVTEFEIGVSLKLISNS